MGSKIPKCQCLHDRGLVLPDKAEEKTAGGLIIPDTAKERPRTGTVIASGPGIKDFPNETKSGDRVYYSKFAGSEVTLEKIDYLMMRESDILLIDHT
jgi:chaperonin GroES